MDYTIHNIKASHCLLTPLRHTAFKTKKGFASRRSRQREPTSKRDKPPPAEQPLCGLLNVITDVLTKAADFASLRRIGRSFFISGTFVGCRSPPALHFSIYPNSKNGGKDNG